jgi:quercetin dioxygenase-like cupin family protein
LPSKKALAKKHRKSTHYLQILNGMEKKEFEKSVVFRFDELVQYSTDTIISRTVLNKQTGTVTLFAFDKGQALSEHTAPYDAMVQVVDGLAIILINGNEFKVDKGETIIMPANVPHAVQATEKFKMVLTMVKSV